MNLLATMPDPNSYSSIGWLLVAVVALITGVNQVLKLVDRVKDKPAPSDLARDIATRFTTKEEFHTHVSLNTREHENLFKKVGGVERGAGEKLAEELQLLRQERRGDMENIQKEVNQISNNTAALQATNSLQNQRLTSIEQDIKLVLTRLPRV